MSGMRRRELLSLLTLWATLPAAARASATAPPELAAELPAARLQGTGRLRFFGLRIYDIRLWTDGHPVSGDDWAEKPLALEIEYARDLQGRRIAERSLDEMRRQPGWTEAQAPRWLAAMSALCPDVGAGDRITGVQLPGAAARFHHNGQLRGEVRDALFARLFFSIWLASQTSEPGLRQALLGGGR